MRNHGIYCILNGRNFVILMFRIRILYFTLKDISTISAVIAVVTVQVHHRKLYDRTPTTFGDLF